MSRTLVLNATYEPLGVVTDRRALILVLNHRATMVEDSGDVLRFLVAKSHFLLLCASINLFVFHIVMPFHFLAVQYLPAITIAVFIALHLQHRLIM